MTEYFALTDMSQGLPKFFSLAGRASGLPLPQSWLPEKNLALKFATKKDAEDFASVYFPAFGSQVTRHVNGK